MRKFIIAILFISLFYVNKAYAQSLIFTAKGGFAWPSSIDCEMGAMFTGSVENKFNKYLALGINGKFGGADYIREVSIWDNNKIIEERELDISNTASAVNIYPKISFVTTDELILSLVPEVGFYWTKSRPVIYFTDKVNAEVTYKSYNTVRATKDISLGLHLEGQYYLSERVNVLASVGWNNYDVGKSLNSVDLEEDWDYKLNETINFLYFEIGITYLLFGKDIWEY